MVSVFSYYKKIDWGKRRRGWDWVFTTNLLRPAKAHLQSAATANAHASVWMREQAAVFLQIIFFELAVREDFKKAAVASSCLNRKTDYGKLGSRKPSR